MQVQLGRFMGFCAGNLDVELRPLVKPGDLVLSSLRSI